jgi:hypothetical protein
MMFAVTRIGTEALQTSDCLKSGAWEPAVVAAWSMILPVFEALQPMINATSVPITAAIYEQ